MTYISDSYAVSGPLGVDPQVISRTQGFGGYGTLAFDRAGHADGRTRRAGCHHQGWSTAKLRKNRNSSARICQCSCSRVST